VKPIKIKATKQNGKHIAVIYFFNIILLPTLAYFLYSVISIPGVLLLMFFWLIIILGLVSYIKNSKVFCEITEQEVKISDGKNLVILSVSEINDINIQAIVSKRMGIYETYPYLAFKIDNQSLDKVNSLKNFKEYGFIQRKQDLKNYMSEEKQDLYIFTNNSLSDQDYSKIKDIINKPIIIMKPLVKAASKEEYKKVLEQFFDF
jgi:hypothetical protein